MENLSSSVLDGVRTAERLHMNAFASWALNDNTRFFTPALHHICRRCAEANITTLCPLTYRSP